MNTGMIVLLFGRRTAPRALASLPSVPVDAGADHGALAGALGNAQRVAVVGGDADLAAVLTALMRADRLEVEVAPIRGLGSARRARTAAARRVPLVRDDTGTAIAGCALWLPPSGSGTVCGEAVADDVVLFDGEVPGVRIEPTEAMPGVRAAVLGRGPLPMPRRWLAARAVQLGTTGAVVVRDGVTGPREVTRSTFYRHTTGWLRVG